jgi:sugar lactone lactonase YvrE
VWTAVSNGGAVYRYNAEGVLEEKLSVPARKVTACTFGGERLDELFITTSQENIDTREDRLAGSLFRAEVGVKGLPVRLFTG